MLRNLGIKNKILMIFMIIGMMVIPLVWFVLTVLKQSNNQFASIVEHSFPRHFALTQIKEEVDDFMELYLSSKDSNANEFFLNKAKLLSILNEGNKWESVYQKHTAALNQKTFIDQSVLDQLEDDFVNQASLLISYHEKNVNTSLMQSEQNKLETIQKKIRNLIDGAITAEYKYWDAEIADVKYDAEKAEYLAFISFFVIVLTILFFSLYLANKIANPIIQLRNIATDISNGKYNVRANVDSDDELGYLAMAVNNMIASLGNARNITEKIHNINSEKLIYLGLIPRGLALVKPQINQHFSLVMVLLDYERTLKSLIDRYDALYDAVKSNSTQFEDLQNEIDSFKAKERVEFILNNRNQLHDNIEKSIEKLSMLFKNLEIFTEEYKEGSEFFDLNNCLQFVVPLTLNQNENIVLKIDLEDLPKIRCNPNRIMHALVNILDNAVYATANGGEIVITGKKTKTEIIISIKDTGLGISEEIQKELFNPFVTTKPQGTGLGLYIAREIIQQQGGSIEIESKMEKGTTVIIKIPIVKEGELWITPSVVHK